MERSAMKKTYLTLALASLLSTAAPAQFVDSVLSYNPGAGFAAGFTNASAALGAPASGAAVTPFAPPFSKNQIVSIGVGGEITLQMSEPIVNNPSAPYGNNFILFANQFFISSGGTVSGLFDHAISALIQVSTDDSTWYTLNPAEAPQPGALFPTSGAGNPQIPVNPALTLSDFQGQNLSGIEPLYDGSAGGTGYDLAWAEDASGNSVDLPSADYVRIEVQTGVLDLDAVSDVAVPDALWTWSALAAVAGGLIWFSRNRSGLAKLAALLTFAGACSVCSTRATTLTEDFSSNPLQDGWQVFGDTNLFQWNSTNENLDVIWDSSHSNSYFYHPLGTILTRNDNFTIAFDLNLTTATASGYGFELALGLFNLDEATSTNFNRSTGENSPDLVEFDYFPDVGYGPTIWPLFVDTNSDFNYNGSSDYAIYAPTPGDWYHIVMTYSASNQMMITTTTNFEQTSGIVVTDPFDTNFTDFRVNTFSISSYQDDGLGDSIFAQGAVDNIVVTMPPPPVQNLTGQSNDGKWLAQFLSQSNWLYVLQRTGDFQSWTNVTAPTPGNGTSLSLLDPSPPPNQSFYRISASRP